MNLVTVKNSQIGGKDNDKNMLGWMTKPDKYPTKESTNFSVLAPIPPCFGTVLAGNVRIHFWWKCTCPLLVCDRFRPNVLTL